MTADAAHVAAVAEAQEQHETWWSFVWQTFRCRGCDWRGHDPARHLATVAVETLTPLIRAQVAAAIREGCLDGQYAEEEPRVCDACESAAEIAEATP